MFKRLLIYAVSVALVLALAACERVADTPEGNGTHAENAQTASSSAQPAPDSGGGESAQIVPSDDGGKPPAVIDDNSSDIDSGSSSTGAIMWLDPAPPEDIISSASWEFQPGQIGENETILSVSPSGMHILTVDRGEMNLTARLLTGKNEFGWILNYISLYEKQGGTYYLTARMDFDAGSDPELNDTLATCGEEGVAWNDDETRVLLTADQKKIREYFRMADADIFLIDFSAQSIENLTGEEGRLIDDYKDLVPRWYGNDTAYFIRYETSESFDISLMKLNPETRELTLAADLSFDGTSALVWGYDVIGDTVYYCLGGGFFTAGLDGVSSVPSCLLDLFDAKTVDAHPYARAFSSMQISLDGRWASLTLLDQRLIALDIPLADDPVLPQPNPGSAVSYITGREWIPCHNVMLYDLIDNTLVNPFISMSLQPDMVIVLTADFAPDGGSLLCAVFGDGGAWTTDSLTRTTLYQIRLDDGSFDAVRVFDTETGFMTGNISWLGTAFVHMSADSPRVFNYMRLLLPSAFTRFAP